MLTEGPVPADLKAAAREAVRICPKLALMLAPDDGTGR
jgi:ferredoxin